MAARYEVTEAVLQGTGGPPYQLRAGGSVACQVKDLMGNDLTVYAAETGGTTLANPVTSDGAGRIEAWVEAPDYDLLVGAGIELYTQRIRTSPPGEINVKSYGAKGDGVAVETAIITAALAAAAGKVLRFPTGTYLTTGPFHLVSDKTVIVGAGKSTVIKVAPGTTLTGGLFQATNRNGVWMRDLVLDLNKSNTSNPSSDAAGMGMYFSASSATGITDCGMERVEVKDGQRLGIRAGASAPGQPLEVTIRDCKVTGCNKRGIYAERPTSLKILHNRLYGNCITEQSGGAIQVSQAVGLTDEDILIEGNTVRHNFSMGIAVAFSENFRIVHNNSSNNGAANNGSGATDLASWGIVVSEDTKFFTVANNRCQDNYHGGITLDLRTAATETIKDAHGTVANNICSGSVTLHGIFAQYAKGVTLTGNECYGNFLDGIQLTNGAQKFAVGENVSWNNGRYGLIVQDGGGATADCGDHAITGNNCFGNATANYLDTATLKSKYTGNESDTSITLASAGTLTVPPEHGTVIVTGGTTITSITANAKDKLLTLIWGAGATFDITDGSNLKLAGSATTLDQDDTITFRMPGDGNLYETGRSVN